MAGSDIDEIPMLLDTHPLCSDDNRNSQFQRFISRTQSASVSIPMNSIESYESAADLAGHTGPLRNQRRILFKQRSGPLYINSKPENSYLPNLVVMDQKQVEPKVEKFPSFNEKDQNDWSDDNNAGKNEHLLRSGQLGMCNDPYCTTCPTYINEVQPKHSKPLGIFDPKFYNALYGDAKGWARRFMSSLCSLAPGVMNPHAKVVQRWNQFFVFLCLVAIFEDPLFFILPSAQKDNKCIATHWPMTTTLLVFRSITDLIYLFNMLLQFRLAYVAPQSRVVGAGELVDNPKKIVINYLRGYFIIDLFAALPLPQIMFSTALPIVLGSSRARNLLPAALLLQYIPRLYKFLPLLVGQSLSRSIFRSASENFVVSLVAFLLSGHIVGSFWYLFGIQRVTMCLQDACRDSGFGKCMGFIACGDGIINHDSKPGWTNWTSNENAAACFTEDGFDYGIYVKTVNLTARGNIITRYMYSFLWGFQQISTLAGNLSPSYFASEILFTLATIGLGLMLFALLIGNIQNFLQAPGRRILEISQRCHDVEEWMSQERLPAELRSKVREAEQFRWNVTRGANEEILIDGLPEDLQREIRRYRSKFVKKVRILSLMDEPILDAICERLRRKIYIGASRVFYAGCLVDKVVFIVRGKMESIGEDGIRVPLAEGDVCGEELLTWYLEHSTVNRDGKRMRIPGQRLLSNRTVRCLTHVEAFSLQAADLQEVTSLFSSFLRSARVQGAIRYESPYWRNLAATRIQVAWRYYLKKRQSSYS